MGLSRTASEINGDFIRKLPIFQPPRILRLADGVPLRIGYRHEGSKNRAMGLPPTGLTKKFDDIFNRLDRMHERDRHTE